MKLGIMQPYFMPYLGHFDLIAQTDQWVVFDVVQYIRHGWMNRNRILHPNSGWQYIVVPLRKHRRDVLIKDVQIQEGPGWKQRIIGQIQHYKKTAPHFRFVEAILRDCLFGSKTVHLSKLNVECLKRMCEVLGIPFQPVCLSEMSLPPLVVESPGDWSLRIAQQLDASEYINPAGGAAIFDPEKFAAAGIKLTLSSSPEYAYRPRGYVYTPNLSIVDVLMWHSPDEVSAFLRTHQGTD
jgi:hypothetical protein